MASAAAEARSGERVARLCQSVGDARALRQQVIEEIRRIVPFDAYAWLLTDPETSVGSSPLADVPCLSELSTLIRLKYLTEVNRWTRMETAVGLLAEQTDGDLARSLVWRDLQQRFDVVDVASVVFRDSFGCWGFLDLWRGHALGRFTSADAAYLGGIAAPVTTALRRSQAKTFDVPAAEQRPSRGSVVLLLSGELAVLGQTSETQEYLRVLVPPSSGGSPIPAGAYNVAAQLLAVEAGVDANRPFARVHLSGGRWLTLRAARIEDAGLAEHRDIAVTIEDTSPAERAGLFARAHGLSVREGELLGHLVRGVDTRDLARLMFLSQHTVQDHLKSIFAKTSVHSRRTLLAHALGT